MQTTPARSASYAAALVVSIALALRQRPAPPIKIDNFGRVDATLYRGAQPQGQDYADLKALGVKTVINLTSDDADPNERAMTEARGMTYVQIPMTTHHGADARAAGGVPAASSTTRRASRCMCTASVAVTAPA